MPIFHEFPYGNMHDQNYDWILKTILEFKNKYEDFTTAVNDAIARIEEQGDTEAEQLETLTETLKGMVEAAETLALENISTEKTEAIDAVQTAQNTASTAITEQTSLAITNYLSMAHIYESRLETLMAELPADEQSLLSKVLLLSKVVSGNVTQSMTWFFGAYEDGQVPDQTGILASSEISSYAILGAAGMQISISFLEGQQTDKYIMGAKWYTGYDDQASKYTGLTNVTFQDTPRSVRWTVPDTCYAFSIVLGTSNTDFDDVEPDVSAFWYTPDELRFEEIKDEVDELKNALFQITDSSANLLPINPAHANADKGITVVPYGVGVKINGTSTDVDLWWLHDVMQLSAGVYTFSANGENLSSLGITIQIRKTDSSGMNVSGLGSFTDKTTITLAETTYVRLRMYISSGKTFSNKSCIFIMASGNSVGIFTAHDTTSRNDIASLNTNFYGSNIAVVTSTWLSDNGYSDVLDLPLNRGYAIHNSSGLTGLPATGASTLFAFSPQSRTDATYATYLIIYRDVAFIALRYTSDTQLNWKKISNEPIDPIFNLSSQKKIVLIGDSITQGVGSSDYNANGETITTKDGTAYKRNTGSMSWGAKFISLMSSKYGCTCVNNGLPGWDINEIYGAIDDVCPTAEDFDYAIVMCGTNSRGKSYERVTNEITWLVTAIKNKGVIPFVFSTIDNNGANDVTTNPEMMQQAFRDVCKTLGVPFFDMTSEFTAFVNEASLDYSDIFDDTLHPNDRGYEIIYGIFRKLLKV